MSKEFPAIRYHGNAQAGFRHTKRGMLELFRTEAVREKMGVPILKRSVEVGPYTTIIVNIAHEQTFVHIYCNPPELPELIPEKEEKEFELYECPSAFIIRSLSKGYTDQYTDGYVIAYNHANDSWGVASYRNELGGTVPVAGNIGWFHVKDSSSGTHNKCDVVTWKGQSSPNFIPPTTNGTEALNFLERKIFFQGREFKAPGDVVGACILTDDDGIEYMHVHYVALSQSGGRSHFRILYDGCSRTPLSAMLGSSEDPPWESVGSSASPDEFAGVLSFYVSEHFYAPRSTAYVDENGFSYVMREYQGENLDSPTVDVAGCCAAFIKFNLRDMTWEVLGDSLASLVERNPSYSCVPNYDAFPTGSPPTGDYPAFNENQEDGSCSARFDSSNVSRPWVFYVFPGTQNLYTLALEHQYTNGSTLVKSSSIYDDSVEPPRKHYLHASTASGGGQTEIIVYKDFEEVRRFPIMETHWNNAAEGDWYEDLSKSVTWTVAGPYLSRGKWLYEYHPEMKECENYFLYEVSHGGEGGGSATTLLTWHNDGSDTLVSALEDIPIFTPDSPGTEGWGYAYGNTGLNFYGFFSYIEDPAGQNASYSSLLKETSFQQTLLYDGNTSMAWTLYGGAKLFAGGGAFDFSRLDQGWISGLKQGDFGLGIGVPPICQGRIGVELYTNTSQSRLYGSPFDFSHMKTEKDDGENSVWRADAYAIHRPVGKGSKGQKPYLWLRRKMYPSSEASNAFWKLSKPPQNEPTGFAISDGDPATVPDSPYYTHEPDEFTWLWSYPMGSLNDIDEDPDREALHWNDEEWELTSNFISADRLNRITDEIGNNFFHIGII